MIVSALSQRMDIFVRYLAKGIVGDDPNEQSYKDNVVRDGKFRLRKAVGVNKRW